MDVADDDGEGVVPSDASLLEGVRRGDRHAFDQLYRRHRRAALAVARGVTRTDHDAEDLISEAFMRVFRTLTKGGGPTHSFRAYLLSAVRNAAYDRTRRDKRLAFYDNLEAFDDSNVEDGAGDPSALAQERSLLIAAMATLPDRWQKILWYTEIEGLKPAAIAPLLGLSANGTAALAFRAREGLRQAYLQAHAATPHRAACRFAFGRLGAWTRRSLSRREHLRVADHLRTCEECRAIAQELREVNSGFRATQMQEAGSAASADHTLPAPRSTASRPSPAAASPSPPPPAPSARAWRSEAGEAPVEGDAPEATGGVVAQEKLADPRHAVEHPQPVAHAESVESRQLLPAEESGEHPPAAVHAAQDKRAHSERARSNQADGPENGHSRTRGAEQGDDCDAARKRPDFPTTLRQWQHRVAETIGDWQHRQGKAEHWHLARPADQECATSAGASDPELPLDPPEAPTDASEQPEPVSPLEQACAVALSGAAPSVRT